MAENVRITTPRLAPLLSPTATPGEQVAAIRDHFQLEVQDIKSQIGGNLRWGNLQSQSISVTFPGSGGSVVINHDLDHTPELWIANPEVAMKVYATPADKAAWTSTSLTLRSDVAGVAMIHLV